MINNCKHCQTDFETTELRKIYCSPECRKKASAILSAAKRNKPSPRPCAHCNTPFTPIRNDAKYCSDICRARAGKEARLYRPCDDPELYAVTTPYGSHAFDSFVANSFQRSAQCSTC